MLTLSALRTKVIDEIICLDKYEKINKLKISFFSDGTFHPTRPGGLSWELFTKIQVVLKPIAETYKSVIVDRIYTVEFTFSNHEILEILSKCV